jgi:hypothetical protein
MALKNYLKGDASTSVAPGNDQDWAHSNPGPYFGIVKGNSDPTRMGRLSVLIPSLAKVGSKDVTENQLVTCDYLSPFYGAKDAQKTNGASREYDDSQHSYGFWGVPPDLETKVLVIFAEGKMEQAYWIGCIQDPYTNHMVPGIASSTNTWDKTTGQQEGPPGTAQSTVDKLQTYGSDNVPAGELNRRTPGVLANGNYEGTALPIHPFADVLVKQGLSADDIRGNTSSSARRESPSQVFGISTPGRKDTGTTKEQVGPKDSGATDYVVRTPGHTFTMDDGAADGSNQLTRLRTASGHQLLMHDTDGIVYIANGSGNAWIEMNRDGKIDLYSGVGGINIRTQGDFNLHSDANINMHAAGSIRMGAETDIIQSASAMFNMGDKGIFNSSQAGSIRDYARDGLTSFTEGVQLHGAGGLIHLAGSQVHMNSTRASSGWGPKWLTTDKVGITPREEGDVELAKKGLEPLQPFTKKGGTKTTVHRFVTHEPMPRFKAFTSEGHLPSSDPTDDQMDTKMWSRLSNTPGTVEYMEQKNRISAIESIRLGQFQADSERWLKDKMGNSTSAVKARELITDFGNKYDKTFNVLNQAKGTFKDIESISNKLKNFNVNDTIASVKSNITTQLTNQVIESISGNGAVQLFKDNVFVNNAGKLFSLGSSSGNILDEFGTSGNVYGTGLNDVLKNVQGITGNLNIGNIGSVANDISTVTNVYKNVLAGNITNVSQVSSIASTASKFFKHSGYGPSFQASGFSTLMKSVGAFKLGGTGSFATLGSLGTSIATSGFGKGVIGAFTTIFSDIRLKEDVQLVGKSPSGINIYSFKYKQLDGTYEGVMAQEVPWAREMTDTGFYMVDYSKVDVEFRRLN